MRRASFAAHLAVASQAAVEAGALLARKIGHPRQVHTKRSAIDLVTEVDRAAERRIRARLARAFPHIGMLGEEGGAFGDTATRWIVDPLDGTNNFVHGFPFFGVSIGLQRDGVMVAGVIYDPLRRELFTATRGGGARLNRRPIRVSSTRRLAHSLVSTGFSSKFLAHRQPYLRWFERFQRSSHGVRRMGSTVLCLAAVACGRLEGFYEQDLWPWDMAAGLLIVEEAGGKVTTLSGSAVTLKRGELLASNGAIHREMLRVLTHAPGR